MEDHVGKNRIEDTTAPDHEHVAQPMSDRITQSIQDRSPSPSPSPSSPSPVLHASRSAASVQHNPEQHPVDEQQDTQPSNSSGSDSGRGRDCGGADDEETEIARSCLMVETAFPGLNSEAQGMSADPNEVDEEEYRYSEPKWMMMVCRSSRPLSPRAVRSVSYVSYASLFVALSAVLVTIVKPCSNSAFTAC
eukprot:ANDGO_01533.mRNA.1 hypothetical protein